MKEYILKPIMTSPTVVLTTASDKPAVVKIIPPRQPLPTAIIDPGKPLLKLGLGGAVLNGMQQGRVRARQPGEHLGVPPVALALVAGDGMELPGIGHDDRGPPGR
jgi:hypothetical protein